jgi:hypothetical protein
MKADVLEQAMRNPEVVPSNTALHSVRSRGLFKRSFGEDEHGICREIALAKSAY